LGKSASKIWPDRKRVRRCGGRREEITSHSRAVKHSLTVAAQILSAILYQEKPMTRTLVALHSLIEDSRGVTAIEYGLIAALIAVAAVVVMGTVGTDLTGVFGQVAENL
jgi:pilus assembly protein Flp/PilA